METTSPDPAQMSFLHANLLDQLTPRHPLLELAQAIPWSHFDAEFSPLYSTRGKPAKPIRLMVGLSMLKHLENLSAEVLIERWNRTCTTKPSVAKLNFNGNCLVIPRR
jgi:IS5 family transposase